MALPPLVFGVATSAYQLEGSPDNDWTAWEAAGRLKDSGVRCGDGVGHFERWEEDLALVAELGCQAYRFSVEWSRIEPRPGEFDEAALRHYADLTRAVRARGVEPIVTLHHFTHPRWFHEEGSWDGKRAPDRFARFTRKVAEALGEGPAMYMTLNEPMVLLLGGYLAGEMPPGVENPERFALAAEGMVRAHAAARAVLRELAPRTPVAIAHNMLCVGPDRAWHPLDRAAARLGDRVYNRAIPEALVTGDLEVLAPPLRRHRVRVDGARGSIDLLGVNYYTRVRLAFSLRHSRLVRYGFRDDTERGLTDIGWEEYPDGMGAVLAKAARFGVPLWVSENGIDDRTGTRRSRFLTEHVAEVEKARASGIDVRGYLHWSLLDNFEWLEGFGPRFGLYRVDFQTKERTATPAVETFKRLARAARMAR